jgi:hypothetical protein
MLRQEVCQEHWRKPHSLRDQWGSSPTLRGRATQTFVPEHEALRMTRMELLRRAARLGLLRKQIPVAGGGFARLAPRPASSATGAWQPSALCAFCAKTKPQHGRPTEGYGVQGFSARPLHGSGPHPPPRAGLPRGTQFLRSAATGLWQGDPLAHAQPLALTTKEESGAAKHVLREEGGWVTILTGESPGPGEAESPGSRAPLARTM